MRVEVKNPEAVTKRALYLAWKACGDPVGMRTFQDNPNATEDQVWNNVVARNNCASRGFSRRRIKPREGIYGDFVFGRTMHISLQWTDDALELSDSKLRPDLQAWGKVYPTYQALAEAAMASLMTSAECVPVPV